MNSAFGGLGLAVMDTAYVVQLSFTPDADGDDDDEESHL